MACLRALVALGAGLPLPAVCSGHLVLKRGDGPNSIPGCLGTEWGPGSPHPVHLETVVNCVRVILGAPREGP